MRKRLDEIMIERGLAGTRARARGMVLRGLVKVEGRVANKAGLLVAPEAAVDISETAEQFVSFGGDKLAAALGALGAPYDPAGRIALDIGASTGGFTDVLLRRGAARVYAVDVGKGQLHAKIARDPRVVAMEEFDARALTRQDVPDAITALVADVSFISLTKVLGAALALTSPGAWMIALIKPQFEAGPDAIGKGGIVRDLADREAAVQTVRAWLASQGGWTVDEIVTWPGLKGRTNEEYLMGARRHV